MTNEALHFLCNKASFETGFVPETDYSIRKGDHVLFVAANNLRSKLLLDQTFSTWFWRPYMSAMMNDSTFRSDFDWKRMTISPFAGAQKAPVFNNCRPAGTTDRPKFTWKPSYLPDSFEFQLTWQANNAARYINGLRNGTVAVALFMGTQVNPDLSSILPGCDFGLIPKDTWESGCTFAFSITPITYPVRTALASIESGKDLYLLLSHYGMNEYYSACPDDINRLGIVASVIARATRDYGE